ncbi:DUF1304 domain-containing protein [Glutamicibacter protophormiae]|uniref:Membrane protein n=1 Tax=Glutamicibacter protophormiae TaxID=37930 RepID=A0ABS4XSN7_GLUPR|nr:DUF1304 domain-containing protein [Glutamicibacter protophormiae]MBP2399526.1 putative membrane protein [Glutamicibacter protophormiae]GGL84130.1 hypothetical protein GCM10010038_12650 [Glutamicibacter protophormiae]
MMLASQFLALLAALLHVYIFALETLWWERPATRKVFGTSAADARATRTLAFNQGFYNLFLALAVLAGLAFQLAGQLAVGSTLVFTGLGSMLLAALVLGISSPEKSSTALKQGALPLLGLIALALGLLR